MLVAASSEKRKQKTEARIYVISKIGTLSNFVKFTWNTSHGVFS